MGLSFFIVRKRFVALAFKMLGSSADCIVNVWIVIDEKSIAGVDLAFGELSCCVIVIPCNG